MKKYVLFAFIALFLVSSHSAWAQYVKVTAEDETVSWIPIKGTIDGTNIEISGYAIDRNTQGSIDLNEVWSKNDGSGTHYQVTTIGEFAFFNCSNLTSVTIGNSVTTIGESAFSYCSSLTSVTIPNSVTSIGAGAFFSCGDLTSVIIPNSVTTIGRDAFCDCSDLTSLTISNSVTTIGAGAFRSCYGLTSVEIPNSVTNIGLEAFSGCSGCTSIVVESGNPVYDSRNNCNAIIETASNTLIAGCEKTIIPNSVTTIGGSAFAGCSGLTSVTIPNSVTSIGEDAFSGCTGLTSIDIPNSVTTIGQNAFGGTAWYDNQPDGLVYAGKVAYKYKGTMPANTSITIIEGTKGIAGGALMYCSGLISVTIPHSVTSIGQDAFYGCTSVTDVYCHAIPNQLTWDEFLCDDFNRDEKPLCHVYNANDWNSFDGVNVTFVGDLMLKLEANADNTGVVASLDNKMLDVELADRTLFTDGSWNTLCLPFDVDNFDSTPLESFMVKELDTETENDSHTTGLKDGTLYLNFKDATSIEAGKPYIVKKKADLFIDSEAEWNTFTQNVNNGTSYEGKTVMLGADINVNTMVVGTFKGTFDGNGHTISVNLNEGGDGLALFYIVDGATIQNVKVTGTITSSYHRPATFVALVYGSSTIRNCWSSVDIVSTIEKGWVDGGALVARVSTDATLTMTDCAFTGSVSYYEKTYSGGSMVGYTQPGAIANLTNCLYFPTALELTVSDYNPHIFVSGDVRGNLTNCYYNAVAKASILENEGIDASDMSTIELAEALGSNWEVSGNLVLPKFIISDIKNPIFAGVTIKNVAPTAVSSNDGAVSFTGNYNPVNFGNEGGNSKLYLGTDNKLHHPDNNLTIGSCRAFFQIGYGASLVGNVNGDGDVDISDVVALANKLITQP